MVLDCNAIVEFGGSCSLFGFFSLKFKCCEFGELQGDPIDWVSVHRYHHQFCDSEKDPHSPTEGFWFSHMSWIFDTNAVEERVYDLISLSLSPFLTQRNRGKF